MLARCFCVRLNDPNIAVPKRHTARRAASAARALVDECRHEIAQQMLDDTDSDVGHIADLLDNANTSAFARAFRRWSGTTPSRWRMRDQGVLPSTKARPRPA